MRATLGLVGLVSLFFALPTVVSAHCQVPCGIYTDQLRFEAMLEDHKTIAKAMDEITKLSDSHDPQSVNQVVRWINTKEDHASKTQTVIAEYFMTQRIKPGATPEEQASYVKKLTAAHAVMVAAMKCKQTVDPKNAAAFRDSVLDFYRAYEGKEPKFEHDHD